MTFPILSIIVFTPIAAGLLILLFPAERKTAIRVAALTAATIDLGLSLVAYVSYDMAAGGYQIIAGERRWRAAALLKLPTVPAIVKILPERQKLEVALIENLQRADLNPLEEAFAFKRLIEEFGLTQEQVAQKVGCSRPVISNTIRLLALPEEIQQALVEGKINYGQARALLAITNKTEQLEILSSMMGEKITVRELEREAAKRRPGSSPRRDPNLLYLEEKLRGALGTKVFITQKGGRGTITIAYFSKEELVGIIKKIAG